MVARASPQCAANCAVNEKPSVISTDNTATIHNSDDRAWPADGATRGGKLIGGTDAGGNLKTGSGVSAAGERVSTSALAVAQEAAGSGARSGVKTTGGGGGGTTTVCVATG